MFTAGLKLFRSGTIFLKSGITNTLVFHANIFSCCVVFSLLVHAKSSLQPRLNPVTQWRNERRRRDADGPRTASPTFCPTIPRCVHVSVLVGRPGGQPQPSSSSIPIPHPQTPSKTGGAATADHPGGSIFKTLLQNGPTHQGWHTILSEGQPARDVTPLPLKGPDFLSAAQTWQKTGHKRRYNVGLEPRGHRKHD